MGEIITAIAVDDEPKALEVISLHARKTPFLDIVQTFRNGVDALSWLQQHPVDLIFLDINMPHLSGLKFRELIGSQPMIIFTTAYAAYAVESYNLNAVDYLLKPILFDRFLKAALRAKEHRQLRRGKRSIQQAPKEVVPLKTVQNFIYVKSGTKLHKLATDDILYLEKDGNYVTFHTKEKKILSRLNMSQLLELLPDKGFIRVHKSYIIALAHIDIVENHQVSIAGKKIPVTKTYKDSLLERF